MENLLTGYEAVVGTFLPLLISVFVKETWKRELKILVSFGFVLAAAFGEAFYGGQWAPTTLGKSILAIMVLTVTTYKGFWIVTGITDLIEQKVGLTSKTKDAAPMIAFIFFLWIPAFAGMTTMQGCGTIQVTNQQSVEEPTEVKIYKALDISATAYDTAMRSLNDLYVNGVISQDAARKAWDGGEAFYLAQKGAIEALRVYVQAKSAGNEQELNAAILKAGEALAKFTALVTPFLTARLVNDLESAQGGLKGGK